MLTLEESSLLFRCLKFFSSLYLFPFSVDRKHEEVRRLSRKKHLVWTALYLLGIVHNAQALYQLLHLLRRPHQIVLFHLPAQFDVVIIAFLYHPVIWNAFRREGDLVVTVFNQLYHNPSKNGRRGGRRALWKYSDQELIALTAGIILTFAVVFYTVLVFFMDDMAHLLINNPILHSFKSSTLAFALAALSEAWATAMWVCNGTFFISLNCLVLSKMDSILAKTIASLR